jgi:hypothetical protein
MEALSLAFVMEVNRMTGTQITSHAMTVEF